MSRGHVESGRLVREVPSSKFHLILRDACCANPNELVSLSKCFLLLNKLYVLFSFPFL